MIWGCRYQPFGGGGHDTGVQISTTVNLVSIVELLHDFQGFPGVILCFIYFFDLSSFKTLFDT